MLKKTLSLIVTFDETVQALAAEARLTALGLPGRLIPVPREITAGCGLSWKAPPEARAQVLAALDEAGVRWSGATLLEV